MKKSMKFFFSVILFACCMPLLTTSCADREEGEGNHEYILRNTINGFPWRVYDIIVDGKWTDDLPFWFEIRFSASKWNYTSEKFYYAEGIADESTREKYSSDDNTAYTINGNTVEGTVNGKPYFRMDIIGEVTSVLHCKLYFYKENKTYEVRMQR